MRSRYLLIAILLLWPLPASAQPVFHTKRNWTFSIHEQRFGIVDVVMNAGPGESRFTDIYIGPVKFYSFTPLGAAVTTLLGPPVDLLRVSFRPPKKMRKAGPP